MPGAQARWPGNYLKATAKRDSMDLRQQFLDHAEECLTLARAASSLESRTHWLSMALLWHSLSKFADVNDFAEVGDAGDHPKLNS